MNIFTILLTQPLANGLILFYKLLGNNMGAAILGFSVFLKLILSPLTRKSLENMKKMQELKPALAKLQAKHKGDKTKLMKAQSDFYKEKGFNPSAGCLPQILQLVVLYAFFNVFSEAFKATDMVAVFNNLLYEPLKFAQGATINTHFLYLDVVKPDVLAIPGLPFPFPGPILILAAAVQFLSAKMMQPEINKEKQIAKKTSGGADDAMVASQQYMIYMMPAITLLFGMQFSAGLAIYWLVFSALQAVQQYQIAGWGGLTPWIKKIRSATIPS